MAAAARFRIPAAAGALLAGVLAVQFAPALPAVGTLWAALVVGAAFAAARRAAWPLAFAVGLAVATVQGRHVLADRLDPVFGAEVLQVTGTVASVPLRSAGRVQFEFAPEDPALPSRLRLSWYDERATLVPGERWYLSVKLRPPRGLANPGGHAAEQRLAIDGIGATGYVHDETEPRRLAVTRAFPIERARAAIARRIEAATGSSPSTGLVQALAVGVQDAVPDDQWALFRLTGITHLVAISGLHVTLFAAVVALGVRCAFRARALAGRQRWRVPAECALGLSAATAYALLAGWSVPTQRTVLMLAVYAAARLARRPVAAPDLLGLALMAVLLRDPLAALTAGFWLSFGAVGAILAVGAGRLRAPGAVATFGLTQAAVTIALAPASAVMAGGLTWVGAVVNAIAIPAYSFVAVPLVLLGIALAPAWPDAAVASWRLAAAGLDLQWAPLEWCAALPGVGWSPVPPSFALLGAALVGVGVALAPWPASARTLGTLVVVALLGARADRPPHGAFRVTVLDVGQGLATVIETRARVVVYDTGPSYRGGGSAGGGVVVPYLRRRGWQRIDRLVVSHGDDDHAGGREDLLAALPVSRETSGAGVSEARCQAGETWQWDGVRFAFVHPDASPYDDNAGSCVLRVEAGSWAALFTGDIPAAVEASLPPAALRADLVLVPHHGSRTSSSPALVAVAGARWAAVSAGYGNRWGFPKPDVVARWRAAGARVPNTAAAGALGFELGPYGATGGRGERVRAPRWWRAGSD